MNNLPIFVKCIEGYISPFCLILFSACVLLLMGIKHFKSKIKASAILCVLAIFALSTSWLPSYIYYQFSHQYPVIQQAQSTIKWIVVLGGGHHFSPNAPVNHMLDTATTSRLLEGVRLYRQIPTATLILSGGGFLSESLEDTDAAQMARLVEWFNIPSTHVILESDSLNTVAEARAVKLLVRHEPFYLVTSAVHMRRSMFLFKREGLNPIAAPADYPYKESNKDWILHLGFEPRNWQLINSLWHEYVGMYWERCCHALT